VRVIGHLRSFMSKRNVMAFRIIPITDFNELTMHFLEVIHAHLYNTRGPAVRILQRRLCLLTNIGSSSNKIITNQFNNKIDINLH
jgi:hypothetical protein